MSLEISENTISFDLECVICHKKIPIIVYKKDYEEFMNPESRCRSIQEIFHYLTAGEREMFMSQICDDCFNNIFLDEEDC